MEAQSQEVKKLFEEYNKMVRGFDPQDGGHSHHYMFNPCSLCLGETSLCVSSEWISMKSHVLLLSEFNPLTPGFCFSDVPAVQAVHTVGSVPEEDRRSQRHSASGVMMIDSPHEDECTAVGALNPNSSSSLMKADKRCTTCKFLSNFCHFVARC